VRAVGQIRRSGRRRRRIRDRLDVGVRERAVDDACAALARRVGVVGLDGNRHRKLEGDRVRVERGVRMFVHVSGVDFQSVIVPAAARDSRVSASSVVASSQAVVSDPPCSVTSVVPDREIANSIPSWSSL